MAQKRQTRTVATSSRSAVTTLKLSMTYDDPEPVEIRRSAEELFGPKLTRSENNHRRQYHNKTGYRGVNYEPGGVHGRPYRASIAYQGRYKVIGRFRTAKEAARAYDEWAVKIFGGKAFLNFPKT